MPMALTTGFTITPGQGLLFGDIDQSSVSARLCFVLGHYGFHVEQGRVEGMTA